MDLFRILSSTSGALGAQTAGLDVTGQNIANVNTPGYVRRTLDLSEIAPVDQSSAGNGVTVDRIIAQRAPLLDARIRVEQAAVGRESAVSDRLSILQTEISSPGTAADAALTSFYDAWSTLAQDPTSGVGRQQVVSQGQALARVFNNLSASLVSAQQGADSEIRSDVQQVNDLAARIAQLNVAIGAAPATTGETLRDEQQQALQDLASLVDVSVIDRASGGADVYIGNGRALVVGENAYSLATVSKAPSGLADITSGGTTITSEITGGRIGGLIQARDVLIPDYQGRVDNLAYGVVSSVNAAHQAGFDLGGNAGGDFFSPLASPAGAAAAMAVSSSVAANPNLIAAAGTPAPGDNQNARAISDLRNAALPGGTTNPTDTWGALIYRVGADTQTAQGELQSHQDVVSQIQSLRDQVSGVSIDEEAASMLKFQRAYEANARFFSAVDQTLDALIQMVP